MFDLVVHGHRNTTRRDGVTLVISWLAHAIVLGVVVVLPVLYATHQLPETRDDVIAFVVAAPPPPPPAPPPAAMPAASRAAATRTVARPIPTRAPSALPREVPAAIDRSASPTPSSLDLGFEGVPGGVIGGLPGGIAGGIVGGLPDVVPRPPPPSPTPQPRPPVRAGGQIQAPSLIERVPPVYPPLAVSAKIQGVVILEATVGHDGTVEEVSVLRSVGVLDRAAMEAVRQWRYAPLLLNGRPERFILTVTVSFNLSS